jgi:hypothetical protein
VQLGRRRYVPRTLDHGDGCIQRWFGVIAGKRRRPACTTDSLETHLTCGGVHAEEADMSEVYKQADLILPNLNLPVPCDIRVEITDERVNLYVGQRDWSWSRTTGELVGAGTAMESPIPDGENPV